MARDCVFGRDHRRRICDLRTLRLSTDRALWTGGRVRHDHRHPGEPVRPSASRRRRVQAAVKGMTMRDEHDDDLDPQVIEDAGIETEKFEQPEDEEEGVAIAGVTDSSRSVEAEEEEPEDESSDTI